MGHTAFNNIMYYFSLLRVYSQGFNLIFILLENLIVKTFKKYISEDVVNKVECLKVLLCFQFRSVFFML